MRRLVNGFRKNQIKGMILFSTIILTVFIGVSFITFSEGPIQTTTPIVPESSDLDITWEDSGDPQTTRTYIQNSGSETSQTDDFDISVPTSPTAIHSADMNLTILSGSETAHEFENDSPLDYPRYEESSRLNPNWLAGSTDSLSITQGSISSGEYAFLVDGSDTSYLGIESEFSSPNHVISMTYSANFTDVPGYDKERVIGFRISTIREINRSVTANFYLTNIITSTPVLEETLIWDDEGKNTAVFTVTNSRLAYINSSDQVDITIELISSFAAFKGDFFDFEIEVLVAAHTAISDTDYVAMEFDLLGNSIDVAGFFAWVRTLTPTAPSANLNVSLYRANQTARRSVVTSLSAINLEPDTSQLIESHIISNYAVDAYSYIPFKADYSTTSLDVGNYFVVLSADTSGVYSVVTMPYDDGDEFSYNHDPDQIRDHLFLRSDDGTTGSWNKVKIGGGQVDAAPFAINLTRPWLPEEIDLKINEKEVVSYAITSGIYAQTSGYRWGLGKWNNQFDTEIHDVASTITVPLEFNSTLASSISFDVNYSSVVYSIESTISEFSVDFGENPEWILNYTLNKASYPGWSYRNFSFVVPHDWTLTELLDINQDSLLGEYVETSDDLYTEFWVSEFENGEYSLSAESPNYVYEMQTYLQYEDNYWETMGFMQGDNLAVSMGILNHSQTSSEIYTGDSTLELYDPDDALNNSLNDLMPDDVESVLVNGEPVLLTHYQFDSENILNTTSSTPQGEYSIVFKWDGGNELGYKVLPIFIMEYGVDIVSISEDLDKYVDVIRSTVNRNLTTASKYNVSVFAIDDITGLPSDESYHINETLGWEYSEYGFDVNLTHILVNESLFNPGETVKVNLTFESFNLYWDNNIDVNVQFIQTTNAEWIVMEESTSFTLGTLGMGNDVKTIELQFTIPTDYKGVNGPIRLNPFILNIEMEINGEKLNDRAYNTLFPFIEQSEAVLEGEVLMVSLNYHHPGPIAQLISSEINRVEELVHSTATYLIQISDSYYVTCAQSEYDTFSSKPIATFSDVSALDLIWGSDFLLQGYLTDEFGAEIFNQTVMVDIYNGSHWINYPQTTSQPMKSDTDGFFFGTFDSNAVAKSNLMQLNLSWVGNSTIYGSSIASDFSMITYEDSLEIVIHNTTNYGILKEKQENIIIFEITNIGNSTLKNFDISFSFPGTTYQIGDLDYATKQLESGESFLVELYVTIPASFRGGTGVVSINITCENHDSHETVQNTLTYELKVVTSSFLDNIDGLVKFIFFLGLASLIIFGGYFSWKTYKDLQKVPQAKEEKRPRRGRYVEVSKLQKEQPSEEPEVSEDEEDASDSADLDDLLKEEGLED